MLGQHAFQADTHAVEYGKMASGRDAIATRYAYALAHYAMRAVMQALRAHRSAQPRLLQATGRAAGIDYVLLALLRKRYQADRHYDRL